MKRRNRELLVERLEGRSLLAAYIVNTADDLIAIDGRISLREAIIASNTNLPFMDAPAGGAGPGIVDTIRFDSSLNGKVISLGVMGSLSISDAVDIADTNPFPVVIDGAGQRIFSVSDNTPNVMISNVIVRNGQAIQGGGLRIGSGANVRLSNTVFQNNRADNGGAIYNAGGTVVVVGANLSNNRTLAANGSGGGLFSEDGSVILVNTQISFNSAARAGGGIEIVNGVLNLNRTNLINNDVNGNAGAANPGNGGGLHVSGTAAVAIDGGVVSGNSAASEGGGLWNQSGSTLSVNNTVITRNRALGNDATNGGGGIFNNGGIVNVTGASTVISNNIASGTAGSGGGIFNDVGGLLNVTDATISNNISNRAGGGIEAVAGTTTNLINVLLSANNTGAAPDAVGSPGNGGGFHITGAGNATILGGEVSDNLAGLEGGGLWNGTGTMTVNGTLITRNIARGNAADDGGGGVFNNGGTLNITDATISNNIANGTSGSGGGLFSLAGPVTVTNSTIAFNTASRAGGGIEVVNGSIVLAQSSLISNSTQINGGGLHVTGNAGTLVTVDGGSVFGNRATSEGGGLWNQAGSTLSVNNTVITRNRALGNDATNGGGGIFNNGGIVNVTGASTVISNNIASGTAGSGGGIFNDVGGLLNVTDATISNNISNRAGGGIEAVAGTTTNLINVLLSANNTGAAPDAVGSPGNGGGFHITGAGNATILGGEVSDNLAGLEGGGLWNGTGTMTVNGTLITRNIARGNAADDGGGGVFNNGGTLNITDATISNNIANGTSGSGGGLFSLAGPVTVTNSTIAFNTASRAGGGIEVVNGSIVLAQSSLISNSTQINGGGLHVTGNAGTLVTVDGGSVFGNRATSEGGGLWNQAGSTLNVQNGTLIDANEALGNDATNGGGGIFNNGGIVNVTGASTVISNNIASGTAGSGGGIFNDVGGLLNVTDATISNNISNRAGGGIEAVAGTTTNLINVLLSANNTGAAPDAVGSPGNGGGFHITGAGNATILGGEVSDNLAGLEGGGLWNGTGTMTVNGTLITRNIARGNAADDGGGGVFNNGGTLNITDATISNNIANGTSGSGGGLFSLAGPVTVTNSTIAFNTASRAGGGIEVVNGRLDLVASDLISNNASGGGSSAGNGGAVHTSGLASVSISGGSFVSNQAATEGGAIWIQSGSSLFAVNNSVFANNRAHGAASDDGGGALFNNGGTLSLSNVFVFGNVADGTNGSGGGIYNMGGTVVVTNSFIGSNVANRAGGGIEDNNGLTQLTNVTVTANRAIGPPGNGGGIHATGASRIDVVGSTISRNSAASEGGGLWNSSSGTLSLTNSTVEGNSSIVGAGLFADGNNGSNTIVASTISRNIASDLGGGLLIEGGTVQLTNSTISSNFALSGGGIQILDGTAELLGVTIASNNATQGGGIRAVGGTVNLLATIVASNFASIGVDVSGTVISKGNNLVGSTSGSTLSGISTGNIVNVNPRLGPLANNGGTTQTHALLTGSPAIDAANGITLAVDQRAVARPQGGNSDIGSFERSSTAFAFFSRLNPADADMDGLVTPLDVLAIVNSLNRFSGDTVPEMELDVDLDGSVSPLDALMVINILNDGGLPDSGRSSGPQDHDSALAEKALKQSRIESQLVMWIDSAKQRERDFWIENSLEDGLLNSLASYLAERNENESFLNG